MARMCWFEAEDGHAAAYHFRQVCSDPRLPQLLKRSLLVPDYSAGHASRAIAKATSVSVAWPLEARRSKYVGEHESDEIVWGRWSLALPVELPH